MDNDALLYNTRICEIPLTKVVLCKSRLYQEQLTFPHCEMSHLFCHSHSLLLTSNAGSIK